MPGRSPHRPRSCAPAIGRGRRVRAAWLAGLAAAAIALLGCGRGEGGVIVVAASGTPAVVATTAVTATAADSGATTAPTPTPTPAATATLATPRPAPRIAVDPPAVGRGETLLVRLRGASGGTVTLGGTVYPLVRAGDGAWAVAGIPLDAALGPATLSVVARDAAGATLGEASAAYTVVTVERPIDYLTLTDEEAAVVTPDAPAREERLRAQQFAAFDAVPRWGGLFRHPLDGTIEVTALFGSGRSTNGGPVGNFHSGEDLAADEGAPVLAAAAGRVAWAGAMPIRGHSVIVDHGAGVMTGYHHLSAIAVQPGQAVAAGTPLGAVGATGLATGPHLHWELTIYGVNVDPETWTTRAFEP